MPGRVEGKVCIVTGGAGGIGLATCRALGREGAKVVVADLNEKGAQAAVDELKKSGYEAHAIAFNQSDEESIKRLIEGTVEKYGALHVLMNNAADLRHAVAGRDKDTMSVDAKVWADSFKCNVEGLFLCCKYALPHMIKTGDGSIINIGSASGNSGELALTAYGSTKSAVIGFSRYVATQYGKQGVRCNSISPGVILTDTSKNAGYSGWIVDTTIKNVCLNRLGEPEDIANMALFLSSSESSFVTGQDYAVDGGFLMHSPQRKSFLSLPPSFLRLSLQLQRFGSISRNTLEAFPLTVT